MEEEQAKEGGAQLSHNNAIAIPVTSMPVLWETALATSSPPLAACKAVPPAPQGEV